MLYADQAITYRGDLRDTYGDFRRCTASPATASRRVWRADRLRLICREPAYPYLKL